MLKSTILILGDADSPHLIRWIEKLHKYISKIILISFFNIDTHFYKKFDNVEVISLKVSKKIASDNFLKKIFYLKALPKILKIIKIKKPDIIHSHFASSYGLIGAFTGFHPFIVSVWGSDITTFPKKCILFRYLTKFVLKKSDYILCTSSFLFKEVSKYTKDDNKIKIIPFGIDLKKFRPIHTDKNENQINIGIIKWLKKIYGHEYLFKAFKLLLEANHDKNLRLIVVGEGKEKSNLIELSKTVGIYPYVEFIGYIKYDKIQYYHNIIDIAVYPSIIDEGFGVSVLESSACQKPIVASNIAGLKETVVNNFTGLLVNPRDEIELFNALQRLLDNKELRIKLGKNGREMVKKNYNLENNVKSILKIYREAILFK